MMYRLLCLAWLALLPTLDWADEAPVTKVETPPVPAELLHPGFKTSAPPDTIRVKPGINQIVPIALGHLNRLVLPFDQPAIRTINPALPHLSQDYIGEFKQLFRSLALGQTPDGFTLRPSTRSESLRCNQLGLSVQTGQVLEGRDLTLLVGVIKNAGKSAIEFDERACAETNREILAVSAWPSVRLEPGRATELYVALRSLSETPAQARPSLLDAGKP